MHPVLAEGAAWPLGWLFLAMGAWRLQPLPCSGEETSTVSPTPSRTSLGSSPLGLRLLHRFSALGPLMHPSGLAPEGPSAATSCLPLLCHLGRHPGPCCPAAQPGQKGVPLASLPESLGQVVARLSELWSTRTTCPGDCLDLDTVLTGLLSFF